MRADFVSEPTKTTAPRRNLWPLLAPLLVWVGWFNEWWIMTRILPLLTSPQAVQSLATFVAVQRTGTAFVAALVFSYGAARDDKPQEWRWLGVIVASLPMLPLFMVIGLILYPYWYFKWPWWQGRLIGKVTDHLPSVHFIFIWIFGEVGGMILGLCLAKAAQTRRLWVHRVDERHQRESV